MKVDSEDILIIAKRLKRLKDSGEDQSEFFRESANTLVVLVREYFGKEKDNK